MVLGWLSASKSTNISSCLFILVVVFIYIPVWLKRGSAETTRVWLFGFLLFLPGLLLVSLWFSLLPPFSGQKKVSGKLSTKYFINSAFSVSIASLILLSCSVLGCSKAILFLSQRLLLGEGIAGPYLTRCSIISHCEGRIDQLYCICFYWEGSFNPHQLTTLPFKSCESFLGFDKGWAQLWLFFFFYILC